MLIMLFQKNFTTNNGIGLNLISAIYKFTYYKTYMYFEHGISKFSF